MSETVTYRCDACGKPTEGRGLTLYLRTGGLNQPMRGVRLDYCGACQFPIAEHLHLDDETLANALAATTHDRS